MPWSIFTDGGGAGAALTWAQDLLQKIGAPLTAGNKQFVYDWEVSEGGGGKYNPLNQGPVPGQPSLTTTGQQYGGGAADYASWDAGLTGASDYLAMPNYTAIEADLMANNPQQARADLIASPWASSHYGYGSGFSSAGLPGSASPLAAGGGSVSGAKSTGTSGGGLPGNPLDWPGYVVDHIASPISDAITNTTSSLQRMAVVIPIVLAAGGLAVVGFIRMTGTHPVRDTAQHFESSAQSAAGVAAVAA